jgi:hypothetical protein
MMVSASQIRNELAMSLAGILPLDDFEDWFVQNTWNIQNTGSKAAEVLTFAIEELFSEYTSSHISEDKLRVELQQVLNAETMSAEILSSPQRIWRTEPLLSFKASAPSALILARL